MLKPLKNEVRKPTKSISGIVPVAVMLPPKACKHGTCTYCPSLNVPQSYTPKSPVVMRAAELGYDAYEQVKARIKAFQVMHHPTDKIELIIMGGTFLEYDIAFQYDFIKRCYDALNGEDSETLEMAQKMNETAEHRCVALCVETRPDECIKYIDRMRDFGVTRVELGVQMPDDNIYKVVKRKHDVKDVVDATRALRNAGFKIGYHIMPGLPGSDMRKDLQLFRKIFSDEKFKPDQIKIYPCQVIRGSELEKHYWNKTYRPYSKEQIEKLLTGMMEIVPRYCRVMRVMREIPPEYLVAGTTRIDLRKDVEEKLRKEGSKLKEIRYREVGFNLNHSSKSQMREIGFNSEELDTNLELKITKYRASDGDEYFLEIVNKDDILFGLLRLRVVDGKTREPTRFKGDIETREHRSAIIRELHIYGQSLKLDEKNSKASQHKGFGKMLMKEAEKIAVREKCEKISVISGVGVREYYRNLGYELEKSYMIKHLE